MDPSGRVLPHIQKFAEHYLFTKLLDYRDEQEFRLAVYRSDLKSVLKFHVAYGNCLKGIVLGFRLNEVYLPLYRNFAKTFGCSLEQMNWYNGNPSLIRLV
jgi:hypothetical protein